MRKYFVEQVCYLMEQDPQLVFLTADLGFGSFEIIQNRFPQRFFNVGIAEQNMVGMACGLSLTGKKVIFYSIANFSTLRVIEQIRNYLIYHNCQVLIVNGGGGFSYGQLGFTHYAIEDVSLMAGLPEIEIFAPFNADTIIKAMNEWYSSLQVAYLRLEKNDLAITQAINYLDGYSVIGEINQINKIICYGSISADAIATHQQLQQLSINSCVIILHRLINLVNLFPYLQTGDNLLLIEENAKRGGVGQFIVSSCIEQQIKLAKVKICGVTNKIAPVVGDQNYMKSLHGLSVDNFIAFFKE
ncbi:MAG: hypothetical protein RLZZ293_79 [Pseudomonadota bacterium]|jgi:transketolase